MGITELSEVPVEEPDGVSYNYDSDCDSDMGNSDKEKTSRGTATNLIVSQTAPFQMTEDVWGYVNITKENEGNEKHPVKAEEFQITLYSETLNADELRAVLADWVKEYESRLNKDRDQHLKFFLYSPSGDVTEDYYDPTRHYSEFRFESGKTFDNVFYVLEDIDAADLKDTVGERSEKDKVKDGDEEDKDSGKVSLMDMILFGDLKNSSGWDKKFGMQKLTLANLLEVLDGVMEMEGRMLVITTNYPEKLDKALIRPGRIDMKVNFGPMRGKDITDMFQHYFEMSPPLNVAVEKLPDGKWTPAEVTQVFLNNMHSPEQALNQLINSESLENIHLKTKEE